MQVIAFLILMLIFIAILSIDKDSLDPKIKWTSVAIILGIVLIAVGYEYISSKKGANKRELVVHFTQGGSLMCKDVKVDIERFNYENGTESFIAKKEFQNMRGTVISLDDCELYEP
ncbi:MAG: hypothetical protein GX780_02505 [Campylobacteraceae bacterium]|nr:hypothetical protein [Campylobacteraceae bacterium]